MVPTRPSLRCGGQLSISLAWRSSEEFFSREARVVSSSRCSTTPPWGRRQTPGTCQEYSLVRAANDSALGITAFALLKYTQFRCGKVPKHTAVAVSSSVERNAAPRHAASAPATSECLPTWPPMRFLVQNGPFSSFARNGSKTVRPMTLMGKWAESGRAGVQLPPLTSAVALGVSIPQLPQFSTRAQNSYRYRCCTT